MSSLWKPDTSIFHPVYERKGRAGQEQVGNFTNGKHWIFLFEEKSGQDRSRTGRGWVKIWQTFQIQLNFPFRGRLKYHMLLLYTLSLEIRVMFNMPLISSNIICHLIVWKVVVTHVRSGQLYLAEVNIGRVGQNIAPRCKILTRPSWPSGVMKGPSRHNDSIGGESQKSSSIYYIAPDSLAGWWLLAAVHIVAQKIDGTCKSTTYRFLSFGKKYS